MGHVGLGGEYSEWPVRAIGPISGVFRCMKHDGAEKFKCGSPPTMEGYLDSDIRVSVCSWREAY